MHHGLDCIVCGARWFSAKFQGRVDFTRERCPDCGGPLVRAGTEPVVRAATATAASRPRRAA